MVFLGVSPTPSTGALIRSDGIRSSTGTATGPARRSIPGSTSGVWTRSWLADCAEPGCAEVVADGDGRGTGWPSLAWAFPQAARKVVAISAATRPPGAPWRADSIAVAPTSPSTRLLPDASVAPDRHAQAPRSGTRQNTGDERQDPGETVALRRTSTTGGRPRDGGRGAAGGRRDAIVDQAHLPISRQSTTLDRRAVINGDAGQGHDGSHKGGCRVESGRAADLPEDVARLSAVDDGYGSARSGDEGASRLEDEDPISTKDEVSGYRWRRRLTIGARGEGLATPRCE